jgi:hypothetical protein
MSKPLSWLFAVTSVVWMLAAAFSISYNGWLALLFGAAAFANIALGFVLKARSSRNTES